MKTAFENKEITRILVPNYLDHLYFSTTNQGFDHFVIASVVKHPFSVGLGLVDSIKNLDDHEYMKEFLRCWEWTIVNNFEEVRGFVFGIIHCTRRRASDVSRM